MSRALSCAWISRWKSWASSSVANLPGNPSRASARRCVSSAERDCIEASRLSVTTSGRTQGPVPGRNALRVTDPERRDVVSGSCCKPPASSAAPLRLAGSSAIVGRKNESVV
jgi:hypothetical protein